MPAPQRIYLEVFDQNEVIDNTRVREHLGMFHELADTMFVRLLTETVSSQIPYYHYCMARIDITTDVQVEHNYAVLILNTDGHQQSSQMELIRVTDALVSVKNIELTDIDVYASTTSIIGRCSINDEQIKDFDQRLTDINRQQEQGKLH